MSKEESANSKVVLERVMEALESANNLGFCLACGAEAYGVEPDARRYTCEECGGTQVYGAQELLFRLAV